MGYNQRCLGISSVSRSQHSMFLRPRQTVYQALRFFLVVAFTGSLYRSILPQHSKKSAHFFTHQITINFILVTPKGDCRLSPIVPCLHIFLWSVQNIMPQGIIHQLRFLGATQFLHHSGFVGGNSFYRYK